MVVVWGSAKTTRVIFLIQLGHLLSPIHQVVVIWLRTRTTALSKVIWLINRVSIRWIFAVIVSVRLFGGVEIRVTHLDLI